MKHLEIGVYFIFGICIPSCSETDEHEASNACAVALAPVVREGPERPGSDKVL